MADAFIIRTTKNSFNTTCRLLCGRPLRTQHLKSTHLLNPWPARWARTPHAFTDWGSWSMESTILTSSKQTAGSKDFQTLAPQYAFDMQLLQLLTAMIRVHFLLRQLRALSVVTVMTDRLRTSFLIRCKVNIRWICLWEQFVNYSNRAT